MMTRVGAVVLSLLGATGAAGQDRYSRPDPFDASVRVLGDAVRLPPSGARNPAMLALIELKDPELKPLFQGLVQQKDRPVMQADAIVGLGLLDSRGTIDPFILRQIDDDRFRSEVLKTLIGRDLLKAPEINQILAWPDRLLPEDRLFLVATLQRQDQPWQSSALEPIVESTQPELRALALLLLFEHDDASAWEKLRESMASMTPQDRSTLLEALAPAIRSYRLRKSVTPLLRLAADRDVDPNVRAAVVGSALELDPPQGLAALRDEVSRDPSATNHRRYALLLLVVSDRKEIDPATFSVFDGSTAPEIQAFVAAGRCAPGGPKCDDSFCRVIDLGIRPAAEWCLLQAASWEDRAARVKVMNHVLDIASLMNDPREPLLILAVKAAKSLLAAAPEELLRRALDPTVPTSVLESIMLALVDSASPEAAALASQVRGKLQRRYESMALVAMARGGASLTKADLDQLGLIAAGGGRVDDPIQVQAAWLFVKQLGRQRDALARLSLE